MPFSGCFSRVARLLLCKGSLQTHPSDQITDDDYTSTDQFQNDSKQQQHNQQVNIKVNVEASATATTPGVVARLMGLDSLPPISRNGKATPNSVTRSRSVNFMDYLLEFDLSQPHHRRVKTSVSFREVPTHNHSTRHNNNSTNEFFLLYLDNIEKTKKIKLKKSGENNNIKKEEKGEIVVRKERKINNNNNNNLKICKLKDEPRKQISRFGSCKGGGGGEKASSGFVSPRRVNKNRRIIKGKCAVVKPINQKEVLIESKLMKKIKNQHAIKDLQSGCSSEDSSAVSVLHLDDDHHQTTLLLSDCTTRRLNTNPEKKCQTKTNESEYRFTHASCSLNSRDNDKKYYTEIVRELCKMAEGDLKESKWVTDENGSQLEICLDFGHQILDVLVNQVVEELLGFQ